MNPDRCSLLVVDDEPFILDTLSALLADHFEVLTADSGAASRAIFARRPVDLILADQRMPQMSGTELLSWVREHSPHTIRLLMTGVVDFDDTVQAINRGQVFRIILKPWRTDELILILESAAHAFRLERSHEKLLGDLRRLNGELEERVRLRTSELEEAVLELQQRNSMLEKLSLTDALTGLPNRRAVDSVAEAELRRRQRHPGPLALGVVDADHFKAINTRYLLPGGDRVLVSLARTLRSVVRAEDTVGRIGGEEFLVLAPETHLEGATSLAERLRSAVERGAISHNGEVIRATVSAGFVVADPAVTTSYAELKDAASAALAEAKATGRNRCVVRSL